MNRFVRLCMAFALLILATSLCAQAEEFCSGYTNPNGRCEEVVVEYCSGYINPGGQCEEVVEEYCSGYVGPAGQCEDGIQSAGASVRLDYLLRNLLRALVERVD